MPINKTLLRHFLVIFSLNLDNKLFLNTFYDFPICSFKCWKSFALIHSLPYGLYALFSTEKLIRGKYM